MALVVSRKQGERVFLLFPHGLPAGESIWIGVEKGWTDNKIRLAIDAPGGVAIVREELLTDEQKENIRA